MRKNLGVFKTSVALVMLLIFSIFPLVSNPFEDYKWNEELTVALVLSGGGARGFAHIPIIEALEKHNIPIDMVIGTSMGALIGGLYSAGYSPKDLKQLIADYDMIELFSVPATTAKPTEVSSFATYQDNILNISFDNKGVGSTPGLVSDQKVLEMLNASLIKTSAITNFNHLPIPFRCIGTNLVTGEKIIFSNGSLVKAIRASISIPGFFTPAIVDEQLVVDGGLVDNLPIHLAKEMGADVIIAVDVNAVDYTATQEDLASLTSVLGQLVIILTKNTVIDQIGEADLLFSPLVEDYGILDFASFQEIMEVGRQSAEQKEQEIADLSESICARRPCNSINPERDGIYSYLPDIYIDQVYHTSVSPDQRETFEFPIKTFRRYTNQFLDRETIEDLHYQLQILRDKGRYATLSYAIKDITYTIDGEPHGSLEIISREFEKRNLTAGLGMFGSTSIHYSQQDSFSFLFNPNFSFSFKVRELFIPPLSLNFYAVQQNDFQLYGDLEYSFTPSFQLIASGKYKSGDLLALRASEPSLENSDSDYAFITSFYTQFIFKNEVKIHVGALFDFAWYKESIEDYYYSFTPSFFIEGVLSTQDFTLFPHRGTRFDFSGELMVGDRLGYRGELTVKHSFELTKRDSIALSFAIGSTHSTTARSSDYFEYGGLDGIITTLSPMLVQDLIISSVSHFHWFKLYPVPILLYSKITVGTKGESVGEIYKDDPYAVVIPAQINFNTPLDLTFCLGVGFTLNNIDLLIGYATDLDLRSTIFLEVR